MFSKLRFQVIYADIINNPQFIVPTFLEFCYSYMFCWNKIRIVNKKPKKKTNEYWRIRFCLWNMKWSIIYIYILFFALLSFFLYKLFHGSPLISPLFCKTWRNDCQHTAGLNHLLPSYYFHVIYEHDKGGSHLYIFF